MGAGPPDGSFCGSSNFVRRNYSMRGREVLRKSPCVAHASLTPISRCRRRPQTLVIPSSPLRECAFSSAHEQDPRDLLLPLSTGETDNKKQFFKETVSHRLQRLTCIQTRPPSCGGSPGGHRSVS